MTAKRILLVDDQRDVTRMLRASLETLGHNFTIVDVPSGEEALLEIKRGGVDLLITDVRLPGISGLDVIKRLRKTNSQAKIIVMSGQSSGQTVMEAKKLGVTYFNKPVPIGEFLDAVQRALGPEIAPRAAAPQAESQPGIADRLSALRRDLGALAVFLVDLDGKIVVRAGDVASMEMDRLMTHLMSAFSAAMKVCQLLGGLIPSNVQYFDGDEFDIYSANVGRYFALVTIFEGERGSSQMGPVMRYGRQCADDLLNSLVMLGVAQESTPMVNLTPPAALVPETPRPAMPLPAAAPAATPPARPPRAAPAGPALSPARKPEVPAAPFTAAELQALDEAAKKVNLQDALSFWDVATEEGEEKNSTRSDALTWEQAEKLGLIQKK